METCWRTARFWTAVWWRMVTVATLDDDRLWHWQWWQLVTVGGYSWCKLVTVSDSWWQFGDSLSQIVQLVIDGAGKFLTLGNSWWQLVWQLVQLVAVGDSWWQLVTGVTNCRHWLQVSPTVINCHRLSLVTNCHPFTNCTICHKLSPTHQQSPTVTTCHKHTATMSPIAAMHQLSLTVTNFHQLSQTVTTGQYYQLSLHVSVTHCHQTTHFCTQIEHIAHRLQLNLCNFGSNLEF
jgi:hypothetical protein